MERGDVSHTEEFVQTPALQEGGELFLEVGCACHLLSQRMVLEGERNITQRNQTDPASARGSRSVQTVRRHIRIHALVRKCRKRPLTSAVSLPIPDYAQPVEGIGDKGTLGRCHSLADRRRHVNVQWFPG